MKLIYSIGLLVILSGCVKVSDAKKPSSTTEASPVSQPVNEPARQPDNQPLSQPEEVGGPVIPETKPIAPPLVQALTEPMKYKVFLSFDSKAQIIQRSLRDGDGIAVLLPMDIQDGFWIDSSAQSGKDYVYEIGYLQDKSFVSIATFDVHVPLDLLVNCEIVLQKDEVWRVDGRVFFVPGGVITTNGNSLALETGKLKSNQGLIRSFAPGSEAPRGQAGKSGGSVKISARTGEGQIKIEMIGQKGAQGLTGATGNSKLAGGLKFAKTLCTLCNGVAGDPGGTGFRGGNSGSFEFIFFEAHQMTVFHFIQSGAGGAGGLGGAGSDPINGLLDQGAQGAVGSVGANGDREFSYLQDLSGRKAY